MHHQHLLYVTAAIYLHRACKCWAIWVYIHFVLHVKTGICIVCIIILTLSLYMIKDIYKNGEITAQMRLQHTQLLPNLNQFCNLRLFFRSDHIINYCSKVLYQ